MPRFTAHTAGQLQRTLQRLEAAIYTPVVDLQVHAWRTAEPVPFDQRTAGEALTLTMGDTWGALFDCAWFRFRGTVPESHHNTPLVLLLDVHGEMCVVDASGEPVRGLTTVSSTFDYSLGRPGKRVLPCPETTQGIVEVWADAGCNDLFGNLQGNGTLHEARLATCDAQILALYYDFEVLLDLLGVLPAESPRCHQLRRALTQVSQLLASPEARKQGVAAITAAGRTLLAPHLQRRGGDPSLRISAVGHAHMDLAWLWPLRETIRKGARTFATALALGERYPDYVFGASQPQYFQWMKDHYPALFGRIRAAVRAGRIETQGCMWVEADTNVSGGEALIRQILLGRRFWQREFGTDSTYLWLPDVFGYSGALPQILRKAGVDTFATQKLSWSLINKFPHHSFRWQGIDGSQVATHMFAEDTYNGPALPRSVRRIETNYRDKDVSAHALMVFGIGDGGGGPGEEHLERLARIRNLEGLSPVQPESAGAFFDAWRQAAEDFPEWVGELYLERHQGTLTTQAASKRYNRKLELALRDLELLAVVAQRDADIPYPADRLEEIWKEVLLYQFHDILPGSSIKRVYDESVPRYAALLTEVETLIEARLQALAGRVQGSAAAVLVYNSLSWERRQWLPLADGQWTQATVPPMGYLVVEASATTPPPLQATAHLLENDCLRVVFDDNGQVTSMVSKATQREVIPTGERGNDLVVFEDLGDAWDFPMDYAESTPRPMQRTTVEARVDGPHAILEQSFTLGASQLRQRVILIAGSARLDFHTTATWRECRSMLRVRFPVAVQADRATFDIQFGHIQRTTHRNTTWDLARDEVAAHKWADLSQPDFGVALLNDCKYGYRVKDHVLDLNLIRSVPHPGPRLVDDDQVAPGAPHGHFTDQCEHEFTYSLLVHPGDVVSGGVARAGYELNVPLRLQPLTGGGTAPADRSWFTVDVDNVVIEAVKAAADASGDWIVRLYENAGRTTSARIRLDTPCDSVQLCDMMEVALAPVDCAAGTVTVAFHPFEIHTLRLGGAIKA